MDPSTMLALVFATSVLLFLGIRSGRRDCASTVQPFRRSVRTRRPCPDPIVPLLEQVGAELDPTRPRQRSRVARLAERARSLRSRARRIAPCFGALPVEPTRKLP